MKPHLPLLIVAFLLLTVLLAEVGCNCPLGQEKLSGIQSAPSGGAIAESSSDMPEFARTDAELRLLLAEHHQRVTENMSTNCRKASEAVKTIPALYAEAVRLESELQVIKMEFAREEYETRRAARKELADGADYATVQEAFAARRRGLSERLHAATSQPADRLEKVRRELGYLFARIDTRDLAEDIGEMRKEYVVTCQSAERQLAVVIDSLQQEPTLENRIDWLRKMSLAQIVVNWSALKSVGVGRETKVTGLYDTRTVGEELAAMLKSVDAGGRVRAYPVDNVIVISTAAGWERTRTLLNDSIARSDAAGRKMLRQTIHLRFSEVSLADGIDCIVELNELRFKKEAMLKGSVAEVQVSFSARCSLGLLFRLLLDGVDAASSWTFRIVDNELVLEQAKE